ncbi:endonuclease/exonuclease/phosphatase family metal-dependent hydrolase [Actinocorallia herbida]|uniref:Endonuclease/exonuclease/phosphatase family metal-dependent hydrolase n=1 Tax=Actinocorallia herbida TaxID=58109 RepID=A0A3N1CU53_9ACTN|nr:endonuclease/exonuclease/phosphatase family protein [Actinocorallia herbida]ROO84841.1 endonuclease/exonuclease/phosphatase family metal-dependent hydrolase [Actinocorallia herbida]
MRIISVNAWGGAVFDEFTRWLGACDADVLCLQEVARAPGLRGWTRFADADRAMPQRADLMGDVSARLPRHQGVFAVSDTGPVRDDAGRPHPQDFGLAAFVAPALPVVGLRTAFVHGSYAAHPDAWPTGGRPRNALAVRIHDREASRFVTVVTLHGLRDPQGKADTPERLAQAHRLADLVTAAREDGDLTIVCGDLNLLPDSATFRILADIGLTDLVRDADTRTALYPKPLRHASYLLISDPTAIKHFEVVEAPEISDHRPLLLEI